MQNLAAGIITELTIMGCVVFAVALNPDKEQYIDRVLGQMGQEADEKTVLPASARSSVTASATARDYLLFTLHELNIAGQRSAMLGIFGMFITLREDLHFKRSLWARVKAAPPEHILSVVTETSSTDQAK